MSGPNIGFATVSVVPSVRGFQAALGNQLDAPLAAAGASGGRKAATAIQSELGRMNLDSKKFAQIGTALTAAGAVGVAGLFKIGDAFQQVNRTIVIGTGATGAALQGLNEDAEAVARGTASSFGGVGTAIADLNTRLGLTGAPLQEITDQFLDLSRLTGTDIGQNVADITRVFGDWSIATGEQAETLDKLFVASQSTGIQIDRLSQSVVQFGAPLRQLGFTFEESVAIFSKFEKEGVNIETVLAGLRRGLGNFAKAGEDPAEAFDRVVESIANAGSTAEANSISLEVFGVRAGADLAAAIREGRFEIDELVSTLGTSKGALDETAAAAETLQERFAKAFNNLQIGLEPIGDAALSGFEKLAGVVEGTADTFAGLPDPLKSAVGNLTAVGSAGAIAAGSLLLATSAAIKTSAAVKSLTAQSALLRGVLSGPVPFLVGIGVVAGTVSVINDLTGRTRELTRAAEELQAALDVGEPSLRKFERLATTADEFGSGLDPRNWRNAFDDLIASGVEFSNGTTTSLRKVQDAIEEVGEGGLGPLRELSDQLEAERDRVGESSRVWDDYGRILDEVAKKRLELLGPDFGQNAGALIAEVNLGADPVDALEKINAVSSDLAQAFRGGSQAAGTFTEELAALETRVGLAELSFNALSAASTGFAESLERSSGAGLLSAGLSAGGALRALRDGFTPDPVKADQAASATTRARKSIDLLRDSLSRAAPEASDVSIQLGALGAAATAFSESIATQNSFASQVGAALGLSNAFQDFRKTIFRLPPELDVVGLSLDKLRPRTREAIQNVLNLGEASRDYLATLLETGESSGKVRGEAQRLRDAFADQLKQAGLTESQIAEYIKTLGLTPDQIETAITVAGLEESRFKLEAYLGLLEGRIPDVIASAVIADIESGNIEAASKRLAELAKQNPPRIDIEIGVDEQSVEKAREAAKVLFELPSAFDPLQAALGNYSEGQENGLQAVVALSEAGREYLSQLIAIGDYDGAREAAAKLAEGYGSTLQGLTDNTIELDSYLQLLGLTPEQVETAISVAGFDEAIFQLQFLRDFLKDEEGESTIPREVEVFIATQIAEENFTGAADVLSAYTTDIQDGLIEDPLLLFLFPELGPADEEIDDWRAKLNEREPGRVPVGANLVPASDEVRTWGELLGLSRPFPAPVGANTDPADAAVDEFGIQLAGRPPFEIEIDGDTEKLRNRLDAFFREFAASPFASTPFGNRASGGPMEPGRPYVVGEFGPEVIVPTGNNTVLNQNQLANMGGGRSEFNAHFHQVERVPRPEDAFRVWESQEFLAGFNR